MKYLDKDQKIAVYFDTEKLLSRVAKLNFFLEDENKVWLKDIKTDESFSISTDDLIKVTVADLLNQTNELVDRKEVFEYIDRNNASKVTQFGLFEKVTHDNVKTGDQIISDLLESEGIKILHYVVNVKKDYLVVSQNKDHKIRTGAGVVIDKCYIKI